MNSFRFEFEDVASSNKAIVATEHLEQNTWAIKYNKPQFSFAATAWEDLFDSAFKKASENGATKIVVRLRTDYEHSKFSNILSKLDFKIEDSRVEFRSEVSELPGSDDSPLSWKSCTELKWSEDDLANFVVRVTEGSLYSQSAASAPAFISDWIQHDELSHGMDCIHIAWIENQPTAICVAQVERETGWSRLAYMGLMPEYRSRQLGQWVHRHGFTMLRSQGGVEYVGGTSTANKPMIDLFLKHRCEKLWTLEEWAYGKTN
ncbi:MAG: hypothetical protein ACKOX6_17730 [Bdellovibrio sp.]